MLNFSVQLSHDICFIPILTSALRLRTHPALIRVKEEDHEENSPRPRANSQISTGFQPSASDVPSSATSPHQQPHVSQTTFTRETVADIFRSGTSRKSPAPLETTATSLPKKRRVTVSGDAPSALRIVPLIPAPLRGLNSSAPPEEIEQLQTAVQLKQQQKALINARRVGKSGGPTPEPSPLSSSFVQTNMSRPSDPSGSQTTLGTLTSPISLWNSSEVAGPTHSSTSASTLPHEHASRTSSPLQDTSRSPQIRSRKIRQTIAGPSSSTMAAALDLEMEVEEGQSDATQITRRRTQSSVLPTSTIGGYGVSNSGSSSASRRVKMRPIARPTIAEMERSLDSHAAQFASREIGSFAGNNIPPPRRADTYEPEAERSVYGQASGIDSPGGLVRPSHSSPRLFRSTPTGSAIPDIGPSGRPEITLPQPQSTLPGPSSGYFRLDTESARHHSRPYRDDDNGQSGQSGFSTPSLPGVQTIQSGFSFSRSGGVGDGARSRRASFVGTPQTPASSHFTSRSPVAEIPQTRLPPIASRVGPIFQQRPPFASEPSSANLEFPPAAGVDQFISKDQFVSLFEGMYDSMADARRVRAWIEEQRSIRAAETSSELPSSSTAHDNSETSRTISFGGQSYVRTEDVKSLIDARVEGVRQENRREIENLLRRVDELEKRVEEKLETEERQGSATPAALAPPLAPSSVSANGSGHASARTTPVGMAGEMDVDDDHAVDGSRQDATTCRLPLSGNIFE